MIIHLLCIIKITSITERELIKLKKADEALYDKIMPEYKEMVAKYTIFK